MPLRLQSNTRDTKTATKTPSRYHFTFEDGRTCCRSDKLDHLCAACQAAARALEIPDAYAEALAQREGSTASPTPAPAPSGDVYANPPDPWAAALAARKAQEDNAQ